MSTHANKHYLITIHHYTDYWEIHCLPHTTSHAVIQCPKAHFAIYGIPNTLVTHNWPQFRSHEYERFAHEWTLTVQQAHHITVKAMEKTIGYKNSKQVDDQGHKGSQRLAANYPRLKKHSYRRQQPQQPSTKLHAR